MRNALRGANEGRRRNLASVLKLIDSMSHKSILARGFALVREGAKGPPIRSAAAIAAGQALTLVFADGSVAATANGGEPSQGADEAGARAKPAPTRKTSAKTPANQGSLF